MDPGIPGGPAFVSRPRGRACLTTGEDQQGSGVEGSESNAGVDVTHQGLRSVTDFGFGCEETVECVRRDSFHLFRILSKAASPIRVLRVELRLYPGRLDVENGPQCAHRIKYPPAINQFQLDPPQY